jgi:hypothetical protein
MTTATSQNGFINQFINESAWTQSSLDWKSLLHHHIIIPGTKKAIYQRHHYVILASSYG